MTDIRLEREVAASTGRVWDVMTDLDRAPEVLSGITRVERVGGPPDGFGVGTRWRETRVLFGREATEELTVTAMEPGRSYTVEADSGGTHYVSVMGVEPLDGERARLWLTFGARSDGLLRTLLAKTVGRLAEGATRKALRQDLDDIARAAEKAGDAPG